MKKIFIKSYDKVILSVLGIIAFLTGCELIKPPVVEYGVPTADFVIKGTITDSLTAKPLAKIRVVRVDTNYPKHGDTIYTGVDGKYAFDFSDFPLEIPTFHLTVDDVDGAGSGGDFAGKELDVVIKSTDWVEKGSGWYSGKAIKTQDIKLRAKK